MNASAGCGGRKLSDVTHMQPEWLEHAQRRYGFGRVRVKGRHLSFDYVHSETGEVADSVDLKIGRSAMRPCNALALGNELMNQTRKIIYSEEILDEAVGGQVLPTQPMEGVLALAAAHPQPLELDSQVEPTRVEVQ